MKKIVKTILNAAILFVTLILAGYIQLLILQPSIYHVYIGKSFVVWGMCWYILYSSIIGTAAFIGLYNKK